MSGGGMSMAFDAIVFDFDGVILESATIKTDAFPEVFSDFPEYHNAIRQYHLENVGISRFKKFDWIYENLLKSELTEAKRESLGKAFGDLVRAKIQSCPFVPGAESALNALQGTIPLFVASGTPQLDLEDVVRTRELVGVFSELWGSPTPKVDAIRMVLDRTQATRDRVLMIGDGESDWRAAEEAGVRFLARRTDEFVGDWTSKNVSIVENLTLLPEFVREGRISE